jgi:methyl-accepting chemotaxis protein
MSEEFWKWLLNNGLAVAVLFAVGAFTWRILAAAVNRGSDRFISHLDKLDESLDKQSQVMDRASQRLEGIGTEVHETNGMVRDIHNSVVTRGQKSG